MTAWPDGFGLRRYDSLDSTNEEARRLAHTGEHGPLWIVAREQTKGRGRRGRNWVSEPGNLFATLLLETPTNTAAQLGFAAGLACGDCIAHDAPSAKVTLKWPNDVLLDGRKAAGILLEGVGQDTLAIGIGINLAHHPETAEFPATSLKMVAGSAPDTDDALVHLATAMATWYEVWRTQGFAPLRDAWLKRAAGLGMDIRARLHEGEMQGIFDGLDEDGALLLRDASGARSRIAAADVFFPV